MSSRGQSVRGTCWSITINNPVASDEEAISSARQRSGWSVEGQLEQGENGTPHYQLMVKTPQVRFSAVKKQFPRAHIQLARNVEALANYVKKDDTRIASLPETSAQYPSLQTMWDMFADWVPDHTKGAYLNFDKDAYLEIYDKFVSVHIEQGYVLETMGVNPQIRSAVKLYGASIIARSMLRRQKTDRQTAEFIISESTKDGIHEDNESDKSIEETCSETSDETWETLSSP
jgi:hypothetical protein